MKTLIIIYDENNINQEDINRAKELINSGTHIDYIQRNLPEGIDIAWEDRENDIVELI